MKVRFSNFNDSKKDNSTPKTFTFDLEHVDKKSLEKLRSQNCRFVMETLGRGFVLVMIIQKDDRIVNVARLLNDESLTTGVSEFLQESADMILKKSNFLYVLKSLVFGK